MAGILVTVCLKDAQGRTLDVQVPSDVPFVMVALGPIGGFIFDRTEERHPVTFARIYQQRLGAAPEPVTEDASHVIAFANN